MRLLPPRYQNRQRPRTLRVVMFLRGLMVRFTPTAWELLPLFQFYILEDRRPPCLSPIRLILSHLRRDRINRNSTSLRFDLRPGSLTRRLQQCGKPGLPLKAEGATGHGPYWFDLQGPGENVHARFQRSRWSAPGTDRRARVSVPWYARASSDLPRGTTGPMTKKKKRLRDGLHRRD